MPALQAKSPVRHPQVVVADHGQLEQRIARCQSQAKAAAESGDITASARFILESLDAERRLAGRGPQVLQLIKPRN